MSGKEEYKFSFGDIFAVLRKILSAERQLYVTIIIYSVVVGILSLAIPTSVQYLIGSVIHTALVNPIIFLGTVLFLLLVFHGIFNLMQLYVVELFKRRFFSRMSTDIMLRILYSEHSYLESQNKLDYCNRFFDITLLQRRVPELLINGLTLFQQMAMGLIVISLYHLYLFLFSFIFGFCLYLVCRIYGMRAVNAAISESYSKYDVASWLEDVARMHQELKTQKNAKFAIRKTDNVINAYLNSRVRFFSILFLQSVLIFLIVAGLGTTFFIAGGLLVIKGQLTIGQLVASELILMSILTSLSSSYKVLDAFYDLCAASKKLSTFYNIPMENRRGLTELEPDANAQYDNMLDFRQSRVFYQGKMYNFDLGFKSGSLSLICVSNSNSERLFSNLALKFMATSSGEVCYCGTNLFDLSSTTLRDKITLIDSEQIYDTTIIEYLTNGDTSIPTSVVNRALEAVELQTHAYRLDLNMRIFGEGYPLSRLQVVRLKVAKAIISKPAALILTRVFDQIKVVRRNTILGYIRRYLPKMTVIYFSNRKDFVPGLFDKYIFLQTDEAIEFKNAKELADFEGKYYIDQRNVRK